MSSLRRDFLKLASAGFVATATVATPGALAEITSPPSYDPTTVFDVKAIPTGRLCMLLDSPQEQGRALS